MVGGALSRHAKHRELYPSFHRLATIPAWSYDAYSS